MWAWVVQTQFSQVPCVAILGFLACSSESRVWRKSSSLFQEFSGKEFLGRLPKSYTVFLEKWLLYLLRVDYVIPLAGVVLWGLTLGLSAPRAVNNNSTTISMTKDPYRHPKSPGMGCFWHFLQSGDTLVLPNLKLKTVEEKQQRRQDFGRWRGLLFFSSASEGPCVRPAEFHSLPAMLVQDLQKAHSLGVIER